MRPIPPDALAEHAAFLRALARRLVRDPNAADDAEQETWLGALRLPPRHGANPRGWLARALERLVRRDARARTRRERRERLAARPEAQPGPAETLAREEVLRRVTAAVLALDEPYRSTVLQRFYEGLAPAEIARRSGAPAGTVRSRLKRALDELRARLDRDLGGRDAWTLALLPLARDARRAALAAGSTTALLGGLSMSTLAKCAAALGIAGVLVGIPLAVHLSRPEAPSATAPATARADELTELEVAAAPPRSETVAGERTPVASDLASPAAAAGEARFRIVESDGTPAAGALAALCDPGGGHADAHTDENGVARFAASLDTRTLVVERRAAPPWRGPVEPTPGEHAIRLPEGEHVAGVVLVDGDVPREPLVLELHPGADPERPLPYFTLQQLRRLKPGDDPVDRLLSERPVVATTTEAAGSFRFRGLAPDEPWTLVLPPGHALPGTRSRGEPSDRVRIQLDRPRSDLRIELERFPSLRGRIVRPDRTPAAEGLVEANLDGLDGVTIIFGVARTDTDGVFEIFVKEPVARGELSWWELPGQRGKRSRTLESDDLPPDGDLGDLVLAPLRTPLELVVTDPDGRPVPGARTPESTWTDAEGRTRIEGLAPDQTEIVVVSKGYVTQRVALPDPTPTELAVVLQPTNLLTITVRDERGEPLVNQGIEIESRGCPFLDGREIPHVIAWSDYEGHYSSGHVARDGVYRGHARTGEHGGLGLWGLRSDVALALHVRSSDGAPIVEQRLAPLGPEEAREVVLSVPDLPTLCGRVLDEYGEPLAGAEVSAALPGEEPTYRSRVRTDDQGRFAIERLAGPALDLAIRKPGWLPHRQTGIRPTDEELELQLVRGLDVRVEVVDERGRPVTGGRLGTRWREQAGSGMYETADGRFDLLGLPDEPIELALRVGGGVHRRRHDPREPALRWVLPVHGAVELAWDDFPASWPTFVDVVLIPRDAGRDELALSLAHPPPGSERLPFVLPGDWDLAVRADDVEPPRELTARVPVRVEADSTARIELPR
jgi:RNA polymerase sigma-70 factor (ECF subfamily)